MRLNRGIGSLILTCLIWASTYVVTKQALQDLGPFTLSVARFVIAVAILAPLAYRKGYRPAMTWQPRFMLLGLTGVAMFFGLQNVGMLFTTPGSASLIHASTPAAIALLSVLVLKEKVSRWQALGIGLAVLGTLLVASAGGSDHAERPLLGNLLMAGSVGAWAVYTVQGKRAVEITSLEAVDPLVMTTASTGAGLLILLPFAIGELWLGGLPKVGVGAAVAVLYLGAASSALTLFLWNYALQFVNASVAAVYINLVPVVGAGLALLTGETLQAQQVLGGAVALLGVWLSSREASAPDKAPPVADVD